MTSPRSPERKAGGVFFAAFKGLSMKPVLRNKEMIEVEPYGPAGARAGDIVYHLSPLTGENVVHRVVRLTEAGIVTRGDNNRLPDPYLLRPSDIRGRVVAAWRGQARRPVAGGRRGLLLGRWTRTKAYALWSVSLLLRGPYGLAARWGVFRYVLPASRRPRLMLFQADSGQAAKLMAGSRCVGTFDSAHRRWRIDPPFRLFVDERTLPGAEREPPLGFGGQRSSPGAVSALLLDCLRISDGHFPPLLAEGGSAEQWQAVVDEACRQGLASLLYSRMKSRVADLRIPQEAWTKLTERHLANAAKNEFLYGAFSSIARAFASGGVPVMALKGIFLAESVYGGRSRRSMGDIDLLVKGEDLGRAEDLLVGLGFRPLEHTRVVSEEVVHFAYRQPETGAVVDVHWNILAPRPGSRVEAEGLWRRSIAASLAGYNIRALAPEDLVVFLCAHLTKHAFQPGLRAVCDLAEAVRRFCGSLDWSLVAERAIEWGLGKSAYFALRLARDLLQADVPEEWLATIRPFPFEEDRYDLARRETLGPSHPGSEPRPLSPNLARLWGKASYPARVAFFFRRIFPSRAEMSRLYPVGPSSWKLIYFYPFRVADLLRRHGRGVRRRLSGEREALSYTEHERALNALSDWIHAPDRSRSASS